MGFIFILFVCACFVGLGIYIYNVYKMRKVFYENLVSFCNHLSVEINFSKNTTSQVIDTYASGYSANFAKLLAGYKTMIDDKAEITRDGISALMWRRLKKHEQSIVGDFFYELGRHSLHEEQEKIANKKIQFEESLKAAQTALRREASIYLKICIILGIASVILLI